jgi:hypothetical protein
MPLVPAAPHEESDPPRVSDALERWLATGEDHTVGGLIDVFGPKSFALLFVLLLALPALPLPTGGATHVFELVALLLALQLVAGRRTIWLPARWRRLALAGPRRERALARLVAAVRRLERLSRPRARVLFGHRASNLVFGLLVIAGTIGAFLAPPFTGLDTLPALGVVLVSLGVLLEDVAVIAVGILAGAAGVVLELAAGTAAYHALRDLF